MIPKRCLPKKRQVKSQRLRLAVVKNKEPATATIQTKTDSRFVLRLGFSVRWATDSA